jgi:hypothetical protein
MPTQAGFRLNYLHRIKKAWPNSSHPYEQRAITATQSKTRRCSPHSDTQLMAEKQNLSLKPAPRREQVGDKYSGRVQDCKHRSQGCDDSAVRCESRPDGIFGKDNALMVEAPFGTVTFGPAGSPSSSRFRARQLRN